MEMFKRKLQDKMRGRTGSLVGPELGIIALVVVVAWADALFHLLRA